MAKQATAKKEKQPPQPNPDALARMQEYAAELRATRERKPPTGTGSPKRTPTLEAIFLQGLADGYSVTTSAWAAGINRSTPLRWRQDSEATLQDDGTYKDDFCVRWAHAVEAGVDQLEDEAHRRAYRGVEKPVYQGGVMVGTITEYSDTLMQIMLKGKRPDRYNTERHELTGKNGGPVAMAMEVEFVDSRVKK